MTGIRCNAKQGVRPQIQNMIYILLDQLLHMGERENAQVRVPLHKVRINHAMTSDLPVAVAIEING
jgi:hypothetical protein